MQVAVHDVAERLLHVGVVADELSLRHRQRPRVALDCERLALDRSSVLTHCYGEMSALVVQGGIWEVGSEYDGITANLRTDRAAHLSRNDQYRTAFACLVHFRHFGRRPLFAEKPLPSEILVEHRRKFDAGITQNFIVNICHLIKKTLFLRKLYPVMNHLIDVERSLPFSCEDCKHYKEGIKCAAFDIIPLDIYDNAESHNKVIDGQRGDYIFETDKEREVLRTYEAADV